jgi:[ribosomal protein S18]-alanine N-acetyltransferase
MAFTFKPMQENDAHAIITWHYEAPYDFYDAESDLEDLAELLDPHSWEETYYAVFNEQHELAGFFVFKRVDDETLEIGLGLRPDLTGKGIGVAFLDAGLAFARDHFATPTKYNIASKYMQDAGLAFARDHFATARFCLNVAAFNRRAIRVYERAGFVPLHTFLHQTNGGEYEFLHMVRPIDPGKEA